MPEIDNLFPSFPACQPKFPPVVDSGSVRNRSRNPGLSRLRRLLAFPSLRSERRPAFSPGEGEILFELTGRNPENLFLGRFSEERIGRELSRSGILEHLAARGYPDPLLRLECSDPADQRLLLFADRPSRERLLMEARVEARLFRPKRPIGPFTEHSSFRMLVIHWLCLSDPDRTFSPTRPRLPGQERPGLGMLSRALSLLSRLASPLEFDGVLDLPDHYHTARIYSRAFRFLDPEAEGRMRAIARDLEGAPLSLVSEAIAMGCLVDRATGDPVFWVPSEQVLGLKDPLRRYLRSPGYARERDLAARSLRVVVDWDRYRNRLRSGAPEKSP